MLAVKRDNGLQQPGDGLGQLIAECSGARATRSSSAIAASRSWHSTRSVW
jgi:hypothetical protein